MILIDFSLRIKDILQLMNVLEFWVASFNDIRKYSRNNRIKVKAVKPSVPCCKNRYWILQ